MHWREIRVRKYLTTNVSNSSRSLTHSLVEKMHLSAQKIQRWFRKRVHLSKFVNTDDPITLFPIQGPPFKHIVSEAQVFRFQPFELAQYCYKTGKFQNLFTQTPFNNIELKRLDRLVQFRHKHFPRLANNTQRIINKRNRERVHEQTRDVRDMVFHELYDEFDSLGRVHNDNLRMYFYGIFISVSIDMPLIAFRLGVGWTTN
jgi:hypothetical protein